MTQTPAVRPAGPAGPVRLGERAARAATAELVRQHGSKNALLVGVDPESAVLAAAVDALLPGDTLTVVAAADQSAARLREHVTAAGRWVAERVRVVDSLAEADPADIVVAAEPLTGTADETRTLLEGLGKYLTDGGVLTVATPAVPGRTPGAAAELDRQTALFGVGTDLVLRNQPPVRLHRLRFTPAPVAAAERLAPSYRPSSVPLTRSR